MSLVRIASFALAFCGAVPFVYAVGEGINSDESPIESAFASTVAKIKVSPGAHSVPVTWMFKNIWETPMMVERFEESCGCLSGQTANNQDTPESVAPGETGTIRATFTPGTLRGVLRKSLHVRFVGHDKPVELVTEATILSSVQLSAQQLDWKSAEKSSVKTVDVTSGTGADFNITGLLGVLESQFIIIQKPITPGKHYQLHIKPANSHTTESVSAAIQIRTDSPDPRDQVLLLVLHQSSVAPEQP